jgi:hypothetical protein
MIFVDALKKYLGWCPRELSKCSMTAIDTGWNTSGGTGGWSRNPTGGHGWWNLYHNHILVMATLVTAATTILFLLFGELSGSSVVITAIAIGLGYLIGSLASQDKRFRKVIAGELVRGRGDRKERIVRYLRTLQFSVPATCGALFVGVALFALLEWWELILTFLLGMSILSWIHLGITIIWERRNGMTLVSDSGSFFAVSGEERIT